MRFRSPRAISVPMNSSHSWAVKCPKTLVVWRRGEKVLGGRSCKPQNRQTAHNPNRIKGVGKATTKTGQDLPTFHPVATILLLDEREHLHILIRKLVPSKRLYFAIARTDDILVTRLRNYQEQFFAWEPIRCRDDLMSPRTI